MPAPAVREVRCKSALCESGICDFAVNCYTGCEHGCAYCYARFMGRFHHPGQSWGSFVDVKVNAPEVLARQLARRTLYPASVFVSSVCDAYQPLEEKYQLTRQCLKLLLEAGHEVHVQTKSDLVRRDFDLMAGRANVSVCQTITTLDEELSRRIEPLASPPRRRLAALKAATEAGIAAKAFVGPLLPGVTDATSSLASTFGALAKLPLREVYVDRLNLRWGVWPSLRAMLSRFAPHALPGTRAMLFDSDAGRSYERQLRTSVCLAAGQAGLAGKLNVLF